MTNDVFISVFINSSSQEYNNSSSCFLCFCFFCTATIARLIFYQFSSKASFLSCCLPLTQTHAKYLEERYSIASFGGNADYSTSREEKDFFFFTLWNKAIQMQRFYFLLRLQKQNVQLENEMKSNQGYLIILRKFFR